jgi:hypothetical protein
MTDLYAYKAGHDADLEDLTPAPTLVSRIIQFPERRVAISRKRSTQGVMVVTWKFSSLTLEELDTLMTGHGITFEEPSGDVTIYTKKNTATDGVQDYGLFNATVVGPEPGKTMQAVPGDPDHWQDVVFTYELDEELEVA